MNPEFVDEWFPIEQQRNYISMLIGRVGLTRRRAECFVRLWIYLLLKQQQELGNRLKQPLNQLQIPEGFVACTHREAAELFYAHKDRGSDRAAGMMIDKLLALGLIEKQFDGNTVCIQIRSLPNLKVSPKAKESVQLKVDDFNPRTDAVPVADFLARNYNWMNKNTTAVPHKISKLLRTWAGKYSTGMRVLRRCDNSRPVGFYLLYPTSTESEKNFFLPPSKSLHLSSVSDIDPLEMAIPGDPDCTSLLVRSWMIDTPYKNQENVCLFVEDVQKTIVRMQADFPNLWDFYAMSIHPTYEELCMALGFQKIGGDPKLSVYWVYTAVDQFLALDVKEAIATLHFDSHCPVLEAS
ncbi:hypothetical protein H6F98_32120 [Microcoleus sp. FACHB-SPT15]|uniref:hypothetical protein n=1 Tax=Microcoleus sp. FACHB-SPT15 TaxID=2692830 RepID=UPI00177FC609|nr:hypothetical protein [Microcoleus sp. FACHB-SPT15]MBD1810062.1 hypothetical protein [Microcoleus sp. FACHB-SPT15]